MGCWDIFCFLCGNTCHPTFNDKETFLENVKDYEKKNNKWFKPIYEVYNKNPKIFLNKLDNIYKNTKWTRKCTFLTVDNKIVHNCSEVSCNINFQDKNHNNYVHSTSYSDIYKDSMHGVFVHTDCWKFIKNEYKIKLSYSHLPITEIDVLSPKIFKFINYGLIEKYWDQFFDYIGVITDSNEELCNSPLKSKLVAKNIKKIISKLKIKVDSERKGPLIKFFVKQKFLRGSESPSVSATFYKNGLYKVGLNGNIWTIKNNKWIEIKDTIKHKIIGDNKLLKKKVYIADVNNKPIFVLKHTINKKIVEYEILTTSVYLSL